LKKEYTQIPAQLRAVLEEHTAGGYIYVRTTEGGDVEQYMSFDNEISYLSLITKTRRLLEMLEELDRETLYSYMSSGEEPEETSGEDE